MPLKPKSRQIQQPEIAQLVRELRDTMQLSQEKFADELGVTFATINRWENGHATPSPLALKQITTLLHHLSLSPDVTLRTQSQAIRNKYCLERKPDA
ncbi:MAG TPA: helix-turn-helix transcriptional regulator [Crinalium sp.]|jgi:DNA-binding transcriptional regulator YiaG